MNLCQILSYFLFSSYFHSFFRGTFRMEREDFECRIPPFAFSTFLTFLKLFQDLTFFKIKTVWELYKWNKENRYFFECLPQDSYNFYFFNLFSGFQKMSTVFIYFFLSFSGELFVWRERTGIPLNVEFHLLL